jgi:putative FmdB family regulatory protein
MPIYEYKCDDCGTEFEELVLSRAEQFSVTCKSCSSGHVTKMLSGAAVLHSDAGGCGSSACDFDGDSCSGGACGGGMCGMGGCGDDFDA